MFRFPKSISSLSPHRKLFGAPPITSTLATHQRINSQSTATTPSQSKTAAPQSLLPGSHYVETLSRQSGPYYVLLELKGRPYHLTKGDLLTVPRLTDTPLGSELVLNKVREVGSNLITLRGHPFVSESLVSVKATVVEHWKSEKRYTVKTKRRKGYKRTHGHRQLLTSLRITDITVNKPSPVLNL